MRAETPQFKRCCFCIPLRRGLIGWGYVKLALNVLTFAYVILLCSLLRRYGNMRTKDIAIITVIFTILITDTCFNIVFVVAGHQKSVNLLKVSYIYNIVALGLVTLAHCFKIYTNLYYIYMMSQYIKFHMYFVFDLMITAGLAFSVIFVQVYLILLIRSEMKKLHNQALEMQFSNHLAAGEPQCTLHVNSSDTDQCVDKEPVVKKCCTVKNDVQKCCTEKNDVQKCCTDMKQTVQDCCTNRKEPMQDCCTD